MRRNRSEVEPTTSLLFSIELISCLIYVFFFVDFSVFSFYNHLSLSFLFLDYGMQNFHA